MSFILLLLSAFAVAAFLMVLAGNAKSASHEATLVRAGIVASLDRPPVSGFRKAFGSPEKECVVSPDGKALTVQFGYKQKLPLEIVNPSIKYGKAVGDSMSNRNIHDGDYFAYQTGDFSYPSDGSLDPLKVGDIVVANIVDDCSDKGGFKLREIERLVETAHYHGVTYKNGIGTNEGQKRHLRSNVAGKVIGKLQ